MIMIMGKAKLLSGGAVLVLLSVAAGPVCSRPASREAGLATLDFRQVVADAKDKVFPAVVFIKCLKESHESGKKVTEEVAGSGVIISADGEVLTNWHVVDKAVEVRCLLYDGRAMDAEVRRHGQGHRPGAAAAQGAAGRRARCPTPSWATRRSSRRATS